MIKTTRTPRLGINLKTVLFAAVAASSAMLSSSSQAQYVGVTCGYDYGGELTGPYQPSNSIVYPMYKAIDENSSWNEWAAELRQSGVDYVCPNLEGSQPNTSKNPNKMAPFVTALNNQGNVTKMAIFDDNATSWVAQNSQATGHGWNTAWAFDISDSAKWQYIYDWNYKLFYQTVPDGNRFKINGRPLIIFWTGGTWAISNGQGNISRAMTYVRQKCQADFGFNPYIIVPQDTLSTDTTCNNPSIIDGVHAWFNPPTQAGTLTTFNGVKIGGVAPSFHRPDEPNYMDPNHGVTFSNALAATVGSGALVTLCEGFTDWGETASMIRGNNIDNNGNSLGYTQTGYDYPSQRLNILRRFSHAPFQNDIRFESEGCDSFGGASGGTGYFRNGSIKIEGCSDSDGGWDVGNIQAGEWLEWRDVPLNGMPHFLVRMASTVANCKIHFEINGVAQASKFVPNTGGWQTWRTYDAGVVGGFTNSQFNTVRLVFETGGMNCNWWRPSPVGGWDGVLADVVPKKLVPGTSVTLLAQANGKYVTSDISGLYPMIASATVAAGWEHFTVFDAGDGAISLRANSNSKYACADNNGLNPLIANRTSAGTWESYYEINAGGGRIALVAKADSKYVSADNSGANPLIASKPSIGTWESFTVGQ